MDAQQRIAMEAQIAMISMMSATCKEKTLNHDHNSDSLSAAETTAYKNCITKYFEAPNHVMKAVQ